jgi:hypothetical protein
VLASDTDASCSVVTNATTLAHQGRRGGVHPITASVDGGRSATGSITAAVGGEPTFTGTRLGGTVAPMVSGLERLTRGSDGGDPD